MRSHVMEVIAKTGSVIPNNAAENKIGNTVHLFWVKDSPFSTFFRHILWKTIFGMHWLSSTTKQRNVSLTVTNRSTILSWGKATPS